MVLPITPLLDTDHYIPINKVIGHYLKFSPPVNVDYTIPCPFHHDTVGSFRVYSMRNFAKCFGACGHSWSPSALIRKFNGDITDFLDLDSKDLGAIRTMMGMIRYESLDPKLEYGCLSSAHREYLHNRGLSDGVIDMGGIGSKDQASIALPHFGAMSPPVLHSVTYRNTDPDHPSPYFYSVSAIGDCPFGLNVITGPSIFLCESEIDAMTLWEYGHEALSVSISRPSRTNHMMLSEFLNIITVFDGDAAGYSASAKYRNDPWIHSNVLSVLLPEGEDVNSLHLKDELHFHKFKQIGEMIPE